MDEAPPSRMRNAKSRAKTVRGSRYWLWGGIAALIIGLAWFDGGEEALHPISHEIAVPENAG